MVEIFIITAVHTANMTSICTSQDDCARHWGEGSTLLLASAVIVDNGVAACYLMMYNIRI
jgi:hypothetical protein